MSFTVEANDVMRKLELGVPGIDESMFPNVLKEHIGAIEECKKAYEDAQRKEVLAKEKVNVVLRDADKLVAEAKGAGQHTARERGFWKFKYTRKRDEIEATQSNLKELIDCGIHTAEAQKKLVQVQQSLAESQTALLKVQKSQMSYQKQTNEAMQFLYVLGAYNMGTSQSMLINLEATLKGASKEKLGEMAKQQLLMAMEQIKKQENILSYVQKNQKAINEIDGNLKTLDDRLEKISQGEQQQDELIARNAENISSHAKKLEEMTAEDEAQDELIAKNAESISTHAKKLEEMTADDEAQDELIARNAENISSHAKKLEEMTADDEAQDELIARNAENISSHAKKLEEMTAEDEAQDELIAGNKARIDDLKKITEQQNQEIIKLANRVNCLEETVNKKGWKVAVTIMATAALILEILQITNIL